VDSEVSYVEVSRWGEFDFSGTVVPSVDASVLWSHIAKTARAPGRYDLAHHRRLSVLRSAVVMSNQNAIHGTQKRTTRWAYWVGQSFWQLVPMQYRQLTGGDDTLVLDDFHADVLSLNDGVKRRYLKPHKLWSLLVKVCVPPFFVVAKLVQDASLWELLPDVTQELAHVFDL